MENKKVNLNEKFSLFDELWTPKLIGELNGQSVKIAKVSGDFVWHDHHNEDEMFMVIKGELTLDFRDRTETLKQGEMIIVPKGVEHRPRAEKETWIMLFEPNQIEHTGKVESELTVKGIERI